MPDLDDKYSEFSREIGNDEPTQDNAAGAAKEPQPVSAIMRICMRCCASAKRPPRMRSSLLTGAWQRSTTLM